MASTTSFSQAAPHPDRPVLVVVDDADSSRRLAAGALQRRYGMDYEVMDLPSSEAAGRELQRLRDAGAEVALIAANVKVDGDGTRFLGQTRDSYPNAHAEIAAASRR